MAPNKKKKKPAANPARGFATTSMPSKAKIDDKADQEIARPVEETAGADAPKSDVAVYPGALSAKGGIPSTAKETTDMTAEELEAHLENAELESLVEKHASRCIADASRHVARLETEKRQMRNQAYKLSTNGWLKDSLVDQILEKNGADPIPHKLSKSEAYNEEKLSLDLWTLERVLEALRLPAVSEVIKHVASLAIYGCLQAFGDYPTGLYDALKWYSLNMPAAALVDYDRGPASRPDSSGDATPAQSSSEPPSINASTRNSPKATLAQDPEGIDELSNLSLSASDSDEDNDPSILTEKHLRYRLKLWHLQTSLQTDGRAHQPRRKQQIATLESKIKRVQNDVLFDEDEAEAQWRERLPELQAERAYSARVARAKKVADVPSNGVDTGSSTLEIDENGQGGEDELFGDIFAAPQQTDVPDSLDATEANDVVLLDFGAGGGVSMKRLVEDVCKAHDPKCKVQIRLTNNTPHNARHKIEIWWSVDLDSDTHAVSALPAGLVTQFTTRHWIVEMRRIAVTTKQQSEQYICTVCLFLLTNVGKISLNFMARVPTMWKEVMKEFSERRSSLVSEEHKVTLKRLRTVIHDVEEAVKEDDGSIRDRNLQNATNKILQNVRAPRQTMTRLTPEEVGNEWQKRTSRPLFQQMAEVRSQLPVHQYKDMILQCIAENQISVICAETGAGKSSGIPVLLLEQNLDMGHDCKILVTQPRRISAVTLARRVSQELGEPRDDLGSTRSLVGFAIRLESKTSSTTRITYATTGVLLRMIEESPNLDELDYLILDEVHERTMDLDLLFIALKKLQLRRPSLKIVLMSATVDARKFSLYFGQAPVLDLPGRTFPVEVAFLEDAVEATNEIGELNDKSLQAQEDDQINDDFQSEDKSKEYISGLQGYSTKTLNRLASMDEWRIDYTLIAKLAATIATKPRYQKYSSAILIFMPGLGEIKRLHNVLLSVDTFARGWTIHLLHSTFSTEDLERAFALPPRGHRKIVIATNIAETGITIPDVTAVIDTCKEKIMRFDERRQLSRLTEGFVSRSSARQRRGRAARVQEGLCFHLVSKHRHDNLMLEQQVPEMLRLSLQDPMLRIKIWDLGSIEETLNAAIDPPSRKNVVRAVEKLKDAGALAKDETLTPLGQQIARLPLDVSLAKLAIFGVVFRCLDPILGIISLLTSKSPFLTSPGVPSQQDSRKLFERGDSDLLSSLNAFESWKKAKIARTAQEFCRKNHLSDQSMSAIEEAKVQLLVYLVDARLVPLTHDERSLLNKARTHGGRLPFYEIPARYNGVVGDRSLTSIVAMALYPRILAREGKGYRNVYTNQVVSLTARSVVQGVSYRPNWLSFYEAMQARSGSLNVFEVSGIPESALAVGIGEAEVRHYAGVIVLDGGKVKLSVREWRKLEALKVLRDRIAGVLEQWFRAGGGQQLADKDRWWLDVFIGLESDKERVNS